MKEITQQNYPGCSETLIFPFLDEGASDRDIASSANIRVLFEDGKEPRIIGNCSLGELSVGDIQRLQSALKRATELAGDEPSVQCKCGYTASQHWADGSCPGDGYVGQGAPDGGVWSMDIATLRLTVEQQQAQIAALETELARARAALEHVEINLSAIQDYVFAPDASSVNAELMTADERVQGMVYQAMDGLHVIAEVLNASEGEG